MIYVIFLAIAIYVTTYYMLTWDRPAVALLLILAAAPFQTDVSGGGGFARFSIAEVNLILAIPLILVRSKRVRLGPAALPIGIYLLACLLSALQSPRDTTVTSILQMVLYFYVAVAVFSTLAKSPDDYIPAMWGLLWVGAALSIAGMATNFFLPGMNKNGIGASLSVVFLVATELWFRGYTARAKIRLSILFAIVTAGLLLSLSRGAWLGSILGILVLFTLRQQLKIIVRFAVVALPVVWLGWGFVPTEKREYALGFDKTRYNIAARYDSVEFANKEWQRNPLLGSGVGLRKEYDATNLVMLTLAETGILGFISFFSIQFILLAALYKAQIGLPRSDPLFSLLALGGALTVARIGHGMVDHYWSRGAITVAWASVGMATYAISALRVRRRVAREESMRELIAWRQAALIEMHDQKLRPLIMPRAQSHTGERRHGDKSFNEASRGLSSPESVS